MDIGYYNGVFSRWEEIKIPLTDRAVFFGDGIYEVALARNNKPYLLEWHLERFYKNIGLLGIEFSMDKRELCGIIDEALSRSQISGENEAALIYFQVSKRALARAHACPKGNGANLLLTVTSAKMTRNDKTMTLLTYPDLRYMYCNIKTLNLLPAVIASEYAERNGADEAVLCRGTTVTECAHSNLAIIKDGILYTHPDCELILPGISKKRLLTYCRLLSVPYREEPFDVSKLLDADCVLITSSTKLCKIAKSVDAFTYDEKKWELGRLLCTYLYNDFIQMTD